MDDIIQSVTSQLADKPYSVSILNTKQQVKNFYLHQLSIQKEWRAIASIEDWLPIDPEFMLSFRAQLEQHKIPTRVIFKEVGLAHEPQGFQYRRVKIIPDSYTFKSSIDILDRSLLILNPHLHVLGMVIETPAMIDIFQDTFEMLWSALPEVPHV